MYEIQKYVVKMTSSGSIMHRTQKGVNISQFWPFTMGPNWQIKGYFVPFFFLSEMTPLLVNFDPLLGSVHSWPCTRSF